MRGARRRAIAWWAGYVCIGRAVQTSTRAPLLGRARPPEVWQRLPVLARRRVFLGRDAQQRPELDLAHRAGDERVARVVFAWRLARLGAAGIGRVGQPVRLVPIRGGRSTNDGRRETRAGCDHRRTSDGHRQQHDLFWGGLAGGHIHTERRWSQQQCTCFVCGPWSHSHWASVRESKPIRKARHVGDGHIHTGERERKQANPKARRVGDGHIHTGEREGKKRNP